LTGRVEPLTRLYLAAPLFSEAERKFNREVKQALSADCEVFLPQEDGLLMTEIIEAGAAPAAAAARVFKMDLDAVQRADLVLIVLDGRSVDEGAAFELGYGYALGKACIALQTDPRRLLPFGNNPMIEQACLAIVNRLEDAVTWVRRWRSRKPPPAA
jgi:nucleoside 2-deoxyribosyltransferase